MKARSKELLDRALAATVAAIEIYNKPNFLYREEAFTALAINGWELLLKAKWLGDNQNDIRSLYVMEPRKRKDGSKSKKSQIKRTRSGIPFTHSLDYLAKRLVETKALDMNAFANLKALIEMRNSSIHFYNRSGAFPVRLQEIGAASVKNFVTASNSWFNRDLSEFNFYPMPFSLISLPQKIDAVILNREEEKFLSFIESLEPDNYDAASPYYVTVNIDIKLTRSRAKDVPSVHITNNPDAPKVHLTEEQIRNQYPWDYYHLMHECRNRYLDFKANQKYHKLRRKFLQDERFGKVRILDSENPKSPKKTFFSPNIMQKFDRHYTKK